MDISLLLKPRSDDEYSDPGGYSTAGSARSVRSAYSQCAAAVSSGEPKKGRKKYYATPAVTVPPPRKTSKWSLDEDALLIRFRGEGMKWEEISKRMPGRSAISCRLHYQNYLERRSEWDEDRKNKLARLYERFKSEMWSKISDEMAIPWRAAEAMHWQLGEHEIGRRAGVAASPPNNAVQDYFPWSNKIGWIPHPPASPPLELKPTSEMSPLICSPPDISRPFPSPGQSKVKDSPPPELASDPNVRQASHEEVHVSQEPSQWLSNCGRREPSLAKPSQPTSKEMASTVAAEPPPLQPSPWATDSAVLQEMMTWTAQDVPGVRLDDLGPNLGAPPYHQEATAADWSDSLNWPDSNELLPSDEAFFSSMNSIFDVDMMPMEYSAGPPLVEPLGTAENPCPTREDERLPKIAAASTSKVHVVKHTVKHTLKKRRYRTRAATKRHSIHAVNVLSAWLDRNRTNPYPSASEKVQLANVAGLTEEQVLRWFNNARSRGQLSPLEAWLSDQSDADIHSEVSIRCSSETGLQDESLEGIIAPQQDLHNNNFDFVLYPHETVNLSQKLAYDPITHYNDYSALEERSQGQLGWCHGETDQPDPSTTMMHFDEQPHIPVSDPGAHAKRLLPDQSTSPESEDLPKTPRSVLFQCTFCCRPVVEKSWKRHEEATHLPRRTWTCLLTGFRIQSSSLPPSSTKCAFCGVSNPDDSHRLLNCRIEECQARPDKDRVFVRKDGLAQHLRLFHGATQLQEDVAAQWESNARRVDQSWTCGFCGLLLDGWDSRASHIAQHFRSGATMQEWVHEHGNVDEDVVAYNR